MNILIVGGAGFLGSHLCDLLVGEGHTVVCMDNLITSNMDNISRLIEHPNFRFTKQDIAGDAYLMEPIDYVLHLASPASPKDYGKFPIETLKAGAFGTYNALEMAKDHRAKFLLASTSEVYGDPLIHPQPETYYGNVNPIGERSSYDEAKRFAEALTIAYQKVHEVDTKIIRIFNCYGPRLRRTDGRTIPNFIVQALAGEPLTVYGDGSQTRSFCYIDDLVSGIYKMMLSEIEGPVNIGNPAEINILDLAYKVIHLSGSKSKVVFKPLPSDDPKVRKPDISKAKEELKWEPKVSLDEGLKKTIKWFRR